MSRNGLILCCLMLASLLASLLVGCGIIENAGPWQDGNVGPGP